MERPQPASIALVVCDDVYTTPRGKKALIGLFDQIKVSQFPAVHPHLAVYVSLTDVRLNTQCELQIVEGSTERTIVKAHGDLPKAIHPTAVVELIFGMNNVVFPEPGKYLIRFLGNGYVLAQRPFAVTPVRRPGDKEPGTTEEGAES